MCVHKSKISLTLETDAICLLTSIISSWGRCCLSLATNMSWSGGGKSTNSLSKHASLLFSVAILKFGLLLWLAGYFILLWFTNGLFMVVLSLQFVSVVWTFCFGLMDGIELPQTDVDGLFQQVFLAREMVESCWIAFDACTVSFKTLTPALIEDGRFADDLPNRPPEISSSGKLDWSEIKWRFL